MSYWSNVIHDWARRDPNAFHRWLQSETDADFAYLSKVRAGEVPEIPEWLRPFLYTEARRLTGYSIGEYIPGIGHAVYIDYRDIIDDDIKTNTVIVPLPDLADTQVPTWMLLELKERYAKRRGRF